jgi:multicomponent Na+:H+ antiporter subunit G
MIGEVFVLVGALLAMLSALGVVRFGSLLERMHALTKASTGGIVCALVGTALALRSTGAVTTVVLALALQMFTFPVGANLVAHAVFVRGLDERSKAPEAD